MVKKTKKSKSNNLAWEYRLKTAAIGLFVLILAYLLASRAIDTGSWWEYGGTFVLLAIAINRFRAAAHLRRLKK